MRAVQFALLILLGICLLAWATGRPRDAWAGAGKMPFPKPALDAPLASSQGQETVVVAGGCFWGVQAVFEHLKGVTAATAGYAGGGAASAHYDEVSTGSTGHAESVKVVFDPSQLSFGEILMIFFSVGHDPTEWNRQGPDEGTQYRSVIFYAGEQQKKIAEDYIAQLNAAKIFSRPIVPRVVLLQAFYVAEDYHQDYLKHHPGSPYIVFNDLPKLEHLKKEFPELYRAY